MRRKDRQVTDLAEIVKIIDACDTLRLGLVDGELPYIVPVNFGYTVHGQQIELYIHGAMAGRKYELLKAGPLCTFEMDRDLGMQCDEETKSVTTHYQCVMGTARVQLLDGAEKRRAMDTVIMARYPQTRAFAYNPAALTHTAVAKLTVLTLSAKANLPRGEKPHGV